VNRAAARLCGVWAPDPTKVHGIPLSDGVPAGGRRRCNFVEGRRRSYVWRVRRSYVWRVRRGAAEVETVYSGRVGFSIYAKPSGRGFVKRPTPSSRVGSGFGPRPDPRVDGCSGHFGGGQFLRVFLGRSLDGPSATVPWTVPRTVVKTVA
jgi:hypothetical protein